MIITGCVMPGTLTVKAKAENTAGLMSIASPRFNSIDMGSSVILTEYKVKFYKIEVGNNEVNKFTVWENPAGEVFDLTEAISLANTASVGYGSYQFCRFTIDKVINIKGTVSSVPQSVAVTVSGNFGNDGSQAQFLFGTAEVNTTGKYVLSAPIDIRDNITLELLFHLEGTVVTVPSFGLKAPDLSFKTY
jgi:hypothetical protein